MKGFIKQINKKISWQLFVLIIFICIIGIPSLFVNWMIVDDGADLLIGKNIQHYLTTFDFNSLWGIFLEKETGRFRPAYWLYMWLTYSVGGYNPFIHHLINFLICSLSVLLIYKTVKILTSSKTAAMIGGLIFVLAPINLENWYRLGPVEPKIVFLLAISTYFLVRIFTQILSDKKVSKTELLLLFLPTPIIYFLKETSFVLIPYYLFLIFGIVLFKKSTQKKQWFKILGWLFVINLIFGAVSLVLNTVVRTSGSYSSYYKVALPNVVSTGWYYLKILAESYGIILYGLLITFIAGLYLAFKKKKLGINLFFEICFLVGFFMLYIILTPWLIPMGRYLEPSLFFFSLFMGLETSHFLQIKLPNIRLSSNQIKKWFFILGFIFLILRMLLPTYNYVRDTILGQKNTNIILQIIAKQAPTNSHVYWNVINWESSVELIMEANILLNNVYKRPDLTVSYIEEMNMKALKSGDIILSGIVEDTSKLYDEDTLASNKNLKVILSFTHEIERIYIHKSGLISLAKAVIFQRPVPIRAFFERNVLRPQWYVYEVIK
jgi:hypothetical protein